MLYLDRKVDERIVIDGGRIVLTVVSIKGDHKVRLGFEAPPEVVILREELCDGQPWRNRDKKGD